MAPPANSATANGATLPAAGAAGGRAFAGRRGGFGDRLYRGTIRTCALAIPALLFVIAGAIAVAAWPAVEHAGTELLFGRIWDIGRGRFGALPAIAGTLVSSLLALAIAMPLAVGVAIFVTELAPIRLRKPVAFLVDLLAAIPSVVYGLWGLYVLVPMLREYVMRPIEDTPGLSALPVFEGPAYGPSLGAASLVLAIMILPYIAAVTREVLSAVPRSQREAALALGATRWEMIRDAVLPFARSGIVGAVMLGLGRALGETMAVTMVIGNRHEVPSSFFQPAYTMASLLANEFAEASGDLHLSALMAVAGILLLISLLVNAAARWLVWRVERRT